MTGRRKPPRATSQNTMGNQPRENGFQHKLAPSARKRPQGVGAGSCLFGMAETALNRDLDGRSSRAASWRRKRKGKEGPRRRRCGLPSQATLQSVTAFIVLLRGVNVGKAKRIAMAAFRSLLLELAYEKVTTVLNSGNAVFQSAGGRPQDHAARIAEALRNHLGLEVAVVVKTGAELSAIVEGNPIRPVPEPSRLLVAFVQESSTLPALAPVASLVTSPEQFVLTEQAAYLYCPAGLLESRAGEALLGKAGKMATTRNWTTVIKLHSVMNGLQS